MAEEKAEAFSSFEIQSIEEGVSILPATDSRRRMIATIRELQADLAELQEMFSTTQQQDTESTLRVGELYDAVKTAREVMQQSVDGLITYKEAMQKLQGIIGFQHDEHMPCPITAAIVKTEEELCLTNRDGRPDQDG